MAPARQVPRYPHPKHVKPALRVRKVNVTSLDAQQRGDVLSLTGGTTTSAHEARRIAIFLS